MDNGQLTIKGYVKPFLIVNCQLLIVKVSD